MRLHNSFYLPENIDASQVVIKRKNNIPTKYEKPNHLSNEINVSNLAIIIRNKNSSRIVIRYSYLAIITDSTSA